MNKKIIGITGSTGILGSIVVNKLKVKQCEFSCFNGDIANMDDVRDWVNSSNFNIIIHLAAIVPTIHVRDNLLRAFEVNAIGVRNLADALSIKNKKIWMFYASTSHVYKSKSEPISEKDQIEPISEYGLTKYAGEVLAKKIYKNICIGRIFSMYHETQKEPFLYPVIKKRLKSENLEKDFYLYGAESYRDFLNAEDVADIIIKLMDIEAIGTYNIGSGKGVMIKDFVKKLNHNDNLKVKHLGEKDYLVADISKLNKILND